MSDLLERLRRYRPRDDWGVGEHHTICDEAAGEIERLSRELAELREMSVDKARAWDSLKATFERGRRKGLSDGADLIDEGFDRGIKRKQDTCAHGKFEWEDCDRCASAALRAKVEETRS